MLTLDPICLEAIWIKAESLYNSCDFEHAMAVFSHGLRISPGFEGFTTGVAKVGFKDTLYYSIPQSWKFSEPVFLF